MSAISFAFRHGPEFRPLLKDIQNGSFPLGLLGLGAAARNIVIHTLCEETSQGALVITADERSADRCCADLLTLGTKAVYFPARDFGFQAESTSAQYEGQRIGALARLLTGEAAVAVCSAEAALQHTVPPEVLRQRIFTLSPGDAISPETARTALIKAGYSFADMVEGPGQFSLRGGILDIFPANADEPVRVEFWGDEIDTVTGFDLLSQRRTEALERVSVSPFREVLFDSTAQFAERARALIKDLRGKNTQKAKERVARDIELAESGVFPGASDKYFPLAYPEYASILDYFSDGLLFVAESAAVREHALQQEKLAAEELKALFLEGTLCKGLDRYYGAFADLCAEYTKRHTLYIDNFTRGSFDTPVKDLIHFQINGAARWDGSLSVLREETADALKKKHTVVVFAGTEKAAESLVRTLTDDSVPAIRMKPGEGLFSAGYINVLPGSLSGGAEYPAGLLMLLSYGHETKKSAFRPAKAKKNPNAFHSLEELHKGDYIVHATNGIGIFQGIEQVQMEGVTKDYIRITYAKGDVLLVPVTKLELVSKYIGYKWTRQLKDLSHVTAMSLTSFTASYVSTLFVSSSCIYVIGAIRLVTFLAVYIGWSLIIKPEAYVYTISNIPSLKYREKKRG